ncbi:hypothetical protein CAFE_15240 [Caprobacter fermentans]|uniref:Uncharacterized protein n=1 Tax=Caproicibacter fermentans TaxID=2576756 RepID=A0A6N8HYC7_9FIRM|nr:hypothetical protein [Caproicibacter fermentans]MVB10826.1 hypothetical protein [Caproicibacter fermentans]
MKGTDMLEILQTFLLVLGGLGVVWGIYDMFGEGQQNSMGVKKIVGGIAFAAISWFIMASAIKNVSSAEAKAGLDCALPAITRFTGFLFMGR